MQDLYYSLSRYRQHLMGVSMLIILFHHTPGYLPHWLNIFRVNGGIGVDVFFFLSGLGMYHSLSRTSSIRSFYKKRILRVIPTYFIIVLIYNFIIGTSSISDYIWQLSTLGLWFYKACFDWYIPSLLILYIVSPFIYKILQKEVNIKYYLFGGILLIVSCLYIAGFNYINFFFPRIPVFILGFITPLLNMSNRKVLLCVFGMGIIGIIIEYFMYANFNYNFRLGYIYFPYLLIVPTMLIGIMEICHILPESINKCFVFVGGITLEVYLVHLHLFNSFHNIMFFFGWSPVTNYVMILLFVFLISYTLHYILNSYFERYIK